MPWSYADGMGPKAFKFALACVGLLLVLSALPGTGVFVGLFFAFSIAFFIAPMTFGLLWILGAADSPASFDRSLHLALFVYYVLVLIGFIRAFRTLRKGRFDQARSICAKAAFFAVLPMAGHLSSNILSSAWR